MRDTSDGAAGFSGPVDLGAAAAPGAHPAAGLRGHVPGDGRGAVREGLARLGRVVPAADGAYADTGTFPGRGRRSPGSGSADGGTLGQACSRGDDAVLGFDRSVPPGGYAWWYVDAISDDGGHALTIIAFVGSVFSPYYAFARRRAAPADPENHVSINAILYTPGGKSWAMTERGKGALRRTPNSLAVGPSSLHFDGSTLVVDIDEWTVPVPRRLRGRAVIDLGRVFDQAHCIDSAGRHRWRPVAPCATVEVRFERPGIGWRGHGYVDMNEGSEGLEKGFTHWNWSRQERGDATRILYDTVGRDGAARSLALDYHRDGTVEVVRPDPMQVLPRTRWLVARSTRAPDDRPLKVVRTLEDTPFYSRSMLANADGGGTIHESVDLGRFASPIVQAMLPFKMPRRRRWDAAV